jgi:hypothetical protein
LVVSEASTCRSDSAVHQLIFERGVVELGEADIGAEQDGAAIVGKALELADDVVDERADNLGGKGSFANRDNVGVSAMFCCLKRASCSAYSRADGRPYAPSRRRRPRSRLRYPRILRMGEHRLSCACATSTAALAMPTSMFTTACRHPCKTPVNSLMPSRPICMIVPRHLRRALRRRGLGKLQSAAG